jgi:hypothetical protein
LINEMNNEFVNICYKTHKKFEKIFDPSYIINFSTKDTITFNNIINLLYDKNCLNDNRKMITISNLKMNNKYTCKNDIECEFFYNI